MEGLWRVTYFSQRWNIHNTVVPLDGKHVAIRNPAGGGSMFYNFKKFHSIVLLALADANYELIWVDMGAQILRHGTT